MKNFKKLSSEIVDGTINFGGAMPRSLVLVNHEKGAVYNITAKCRQTDALAIAKCLAKAILAVEIERSKANSTEAALESGKRVTNPLAGSLSCEAAYLTDKNGKIIENGCLSVLGKTKLNGKKMAIRDVFRFAKSQEIYKLVVEQGKKWDDEAVARALTVWCTAALEQMDWLERVDLAISKAADSTEKEQKAAEKAEKAARKAAEEAAKEAEKSLAVAEAEA